MRDEKGLLNRVEDEAAIRAAGADIEMLERKMLTEESPPKRTTCFSSTAIPSNSWECPPWRQASKMSLT